MSQYPHDYPRRVLLAVAARSPQIVTETIYALTQQAKTACMPTEIHVITTQHGEPYVQELLGQSGKRGWLQKLCDDYQLDYAINNNVTIHCIRDGDGNALDDIRSREDNTHAADFITGIVQSLTAAPDSSLTVSLSGGRRTMTFYVGYALSLFGRPQDRLTHVIVEEEYFFNAEFYYPPPKSVWVAREDNSGFDASKVQVTLADIPFVRLREGLPSRLLEGQTTFTDTVNAAQAELNPPQIKLEQHAGTLICGNTVIDMNVVEKSFYIMLLKRCAAGKQPLRWTDTDVAGQFLKEYRLLNGQSGAFERVRKTLMNGMTKEYFEQRKSRINRRLKEVLGNRMAQYYVIDSHGKRPNTRFGLSLPKDVIVVT